MFLFLLSLVLNTHARLLSLPDDPYSSPKYKVDFLSNLPIPEQTANHWLTHGLRGGINEFLNNSPPPPPSLGDPDAQAPLTDDVSIPPNPPDDEYSLEHLKMGRDEYICLIPKPLDTPEPEEEPEEDVTPAHSWSLLNPLTCLYHRQPWFTYSYCHNQEIRQFREIIKARTPGISSGPHQPEEDPAWEAYTLGRAPQTGSELAVPDPNAAAANLELAQSAHSRYLVQRWGDGTLCDKTGKPREVEVQFHCSMTTTDTIAFIKETKTCSYVLVVHTPRLCGVPGFKSSKDSTEQALISCREISPHRKPVLPQPVPGQAQALSADALLKDKKVSEALRKTLDAIKGMHAGEIEMVELVEDGQGGFILQVVEDGDEDVDIPADVDDAAVEYEAQDNRGMDRLVRALHAMGLDTKGNKLAKKNDEKKQEEEEHQVERRREVDELAT
ncbi:PRKCSH domain-containing protein [Mycena kentingensis (nom. inval.)]|nr:PRKCSH domain-containing protein [Mycena kentingensis (nom. inval.)]